MGGTNGINGGGGNHGPGGVGGHGVTGQPDAQPTPDTGPGNNGRGHAYGHHKHGERGSHGRDGATLIPTRLLAELGIVQQLLHKSANTRHPNPSNNETPNNRDLSGNQIRQATQTLHESIHTLGDGSRQLLQSAADYLRGVTDGRGLAPETRAILDRVADALGTQFVASLGDETGRRVFKIVERALEHINRAAVHAGERGESFVREMVGELVAATQLERYLRHLEKTGGNVVGQAEAAVARLLYGERGGERPPGLPASPLPHPHEILRDLRTGAFVPPQEQHNPFPLMGRARVVVEMMELMRTLDAVESALRRGAEQSGVTQRANTESAFASWLKTHLSGDGALDDMLAMLLPALPGRAGRNEIPRHVAALGGLLTDADGRALLAKDGTPLKLDRLVWLNTAGGLLDTSLLGSAFRSETFPTRLSPLLVYGFDAIYAVIGFDGRTLASPHFVAVQASVNESEFEWVFGQEPFSEGWTRELIERLKDSGVVEHNLLGEMLEVALADGRFHVALLNVEIEEGAPVPDSSIITRLLPGASGEVAFA
jgi:hypothetical protein